MLNRLPFNTYSIGTTLKNANYEARIDESSPQEDQTIHRRNHGIAPLGLFSLLPHLHSPSHSNLLRLCISRR